MSGDADRDEYSRDESVANVVARVIGFTEPTAGLIGSGLSQIIAYNRAGEILKALGLNPLLSVAKLRRWGAGEVTHLGPEDAVYCTLPRQEGQ